MAPQSDHNTQALWVTGDDSGLSIPATPEALLSDAPAFLTTAMHAQGTLDRDDAVLAVRESQVVAGGSTGKKLLLDLDYRYSERHADSQLFVKFSRDYDDPIRDQAKGQLEAEVKLGLVSQQPGFPIAVPRCFFADYQHSSGTGLLITQCIPFGRDGVEPIHEKCLDYQLDGAVEHYRAILKNLGTLAGGLKTGAQQAGQVAAVSSYFPFDVDGQNSQLTVRYSAEQLQRRLDKLRAFIKDYPGLRTWSLTGEEEVEVLSASLPTVLAEQERLRGQLHNNDNYLALMHWNANIDNAWFWRDGGTLNCGLMDWGGVGQMNIGLALWGALSACEPQVWRQHLDDLLDTFVTAFAEAGGASLSRDTLKQHMAIAATLLGLSWLMDAPAMILRAVPNLPTDADRWYPAIVESETARSQWLMLGNCLYLWRTLIDSPALRQL